MELSRRCLARIAACAMTAAMSSACLQLFQLMPHKKWGFIDTSGTLVIPAKFDDVARDEHGGRTIYHKPFRNFNEGLCAVRLGKKWGFINAKGEFVIQPQYDNAGNFSEGLACVRNGTKYGYIDRTGRLVIPMEFGWQAQTGGGSADNPDWDFTKLLVEPLAFSEGLAVAHKNSLCGYIDATGKLVIEATFLGAWPFAEGYASVTTATGAGLIDKNGNLTPPDRHYIAFAEGLFLAHSGLYTQDKRRLFYFNPDGQRAFPQEFMDARVFSEGLAAVAPGPGETLSMNSAYGYIDTSGTLVIRPQFYVAGNNLAADFVDGRAIVSELSIGLTGAMRNRHGVIDRSGNWIVRPKYDHISSYSDGLARALLDNHWVFLDRDGREVIQVAGAWANSFSEGLAAVMQ